MPSYFANIIIRSVIGCYAAWGLVVITDLAVCESRKPGQCESQRSELRGAATTIPATLLAWLADSPNIPDALKHNPKQALRRPRQTTTDNA